MSGASDYFVVRKGATAVPNSLIHNKELSYQALALALVSLSMPAGAKVGYRQLTGRGLGEAATRKALIELEDHYLRFRFRTRTKGKIRDVTIMSDAPLTVAQARQALYERIDTAALSGRDVLACVSHPDEDSQIGPTSAVGVPSDLEMPTSAGVTVEGGAGASSGPQGGQASSVGGDSGEVVDTAESASTPPHESVDNYRAATGTARCDQRKRSAVDNSGSRGSDQREYSVSAGRTVQWSTVARSDAAHITKVISKSSLRSDNSNQTTGLPLRSDGVVESIPESMWSVLGASARAQVSSAVRAGLGAGWTAQGIRERLAGNPLPPPDMIRNVEGLIISRVRSVVASPAPVVPVKLTAEEIATCRLADCQAIIDGTSELTPKEQVLRANGAMGDRLLGEHIELASRAFDVARRRYSAVQGRQVSDPASINERAGGENSHAGSGQSPALRDVVSR